MNRANRMADVATVARGVQKVLAEAAKVSAAAVASANPLRAGVRDPFPVSIGADIRKELGQKKDASINVADALAQSSRIAENAVVFARAAATAAMHRRATNDGGKRRSFGRASVVAYEPNPSMSALDLLSVDLTDRHKIHKAMFVPAASALEPRKPELTQAINQSKKLSSQSMEQSVPSSRLGRMASFGTLGVGLGLGVLAEATKRAVGLSEGETSVVLSEANAERIVRTLCRVRGAALKIGQMLSIQDEALVSPQVASIFQRVRESADYMPIWQLEDVMTSELGSNWRENHFSSFNDRPFAAASIGQVHAARLKSSNMQVAVKVQYPGVAKSISSDINNLLGLLKVANVLPEGLFIESVVEHMKIELGQECDYVREAECCAKMRNVLKPYSDLYVPKVIGEISTKQILTTEMIEGLTIDECVDLKQDVRNQITLSILNLLLRELFIFRLMQTDPNWANFLYNTQSKKLGLLDFGATREYGSSFVNDYFKIIDGAVEGDRQAVLEYSRKVGFLTGYESQIMNEAHVESVMILSECFRSEEAYDFGAQRVTARMQELVPVMLKHRLCPPPREVYSLHRKMSGLFLLASKLRAVIHCKPAWQQIRKEFKEH